jgi:hypothetical protein
MAPKGFTTEKRAESVARIISMEAINVEPPI